MIKHRATHKDLNCDKCSDILPNHKALKTHLKKLHTSTTCEVCGMFFSQEENYKRHFQVQHVDKPKNEEIKCQKCNYVTFSNQNLKKHLWQFHTDNNDDEALAKRPETVRRDGTCSFVACPECNKEVAYSGYAQHFRDVHGKEAPTHKDRRQYVCDQCAKSFYSRTAFKRHLKKHENEPLVDPNQKYSCKTCELDFKSPANYVQHYRMAHKSMPPDLKELNIPHMICDQCPNVFFNDRTLKHHIRISHNVDGYKKKKNIIERTCPHCEKTFKCLISFKEHVKSKHEKDTPYKCDQCERAYGTIQVLRTHRRAMHQRVKCDQCGQEVCNTFLLKRHKASKHGIAPSENAFQCEYCPMYFDLASYLEKHMQKQHSEQM